MDVLSDEHQLGIPAKVNLVEDYRIYRMPSKSGSSGVPFVLLHGVGLSHRSFTRAARILARSADVIAIDLPGFRGTRRPNHPVSIEQYARGVAAVLEQSRVGPVVVVGHSMGCQIALELALFRPDLISQVVMIGPVVDPRARTVLHQASRLVRDALREPWRTNLMVAFDYARCGPSWFTTETLAMLAYPTHSKMRGLTQPLLVIRGAHDPIAPAGWAVWLTQQVPSGALASIAQHRHNVVHSHPRQVAATILEFSRT